MYDPELYQKVCANFVKDHTKNVLDSFGGLLKRKVEENILDVGCGEGSTMVHLLQSLILKNTTKYAILAADLSDGMINLAKKAYPDQQHIKFLQADILNEHTWLNFKEHFQKVFSMLCLMNVPEPKIWIRNIYNVLKPNGQIFWLLVLNNPMLNQHFYMSQQAKWSQYLKTSPFNTDFLTKVDQIPWLMKHLKDGGFRNITYHTVAYESPLKDAKYAYEFIKAFTGLYENLPTGLREKYLKELSEGIENNVLLDEKYAHFNYAVIVAEK